MLLRHEIKQQIEWNELFYYYLYVPLFYGAYTTACAMPKNLFLSIIYHEYFQTLIQTGMFLSSRSHRLTIHNGATIKFNTSTEFDIIYANLTRNRSVNAKGDISSSPWKIWKNIHSDTVIFVLLEKRFAAQINVYAPCSFWLYIYI